MQQKFWSSFWESLRVSRAEPLAFSLFPDKSKFENFSYLDRYIFYGENMSEFLLEMNHITKDFSGVKALSDVSLHLRAGSVHALMGENGAGKSTLMKCLFGIYQKDGGEILLDGKPVHFKSPREALENGVAMVHQELNQALKRNVSENIWLGRFPRRFGFFVPEAKMHAETEKLFESLGMKVDPRRPMSTMPVAERQMAEIAKAVSYGARVIVLDEPTSSLNEAEVEHLFRIIRRLRDDGCGVIYISHKMEEILRISDEVTVMRDGLHIATKPASELTMDAIIHLMVGRTLEKRFPPKTGKVGEVALEVKNLSAAYAPVKDVSFNIRKGEIVGLAGLGGAGRTEVLEALFGLRALSGGLLLLDGKPIVNKNPRAAIANGFALLTEERRSTGIFGILDLTENTVISSLRAYRRGLLLDGGKMRRDTEDSMGGLRVKAPSAATKIRTLSGGNQQKVILGRWLLTKPRILLLDEPTRGIDVGAKYEIYQLIIKLAEEGRSVLMVSSEMPELLGVCDRILVMSGGRLAGEVDAATTTQEEIMTLAAKYV